MPAGTDGLSPPDNRVTGTIFNIQRFSTEDGPGLRTTAFLKGCPLRCLWCHNPEGLVAKPQLVWYDSKCIACGDCVQTCPHQALSMREEGITVDRAHCRGCGACARACPTQALEILGRTVSSVDLARELARDAEFFRTSGGGVTFSGGEALAQADLVFETAALLRPEGIHLAVDTSGFVSWTIFEQALETADLILYDLKLVDSQRHQALTGSDNRLILDNARRLAASGRPFWVRVPIIPGCTDDDANVRAVSEFIAREMPGAQRVDFLAYNNLAEADYKRLGLTFELEGHGPLTRKDMHRVLAVARAAGLDPVENGSLPREHQEEDESEETGV